TNGFPDKKYLIKCIRFNQITTDEINDIIRKFKRKKINTDILNEMKNHFEASKNNYYDFRDGNFCFRSEILDLDTAKNLVNWISGKEYHKCWYKFELLFNMKYDVLKSKTFHKNCDGKGPTIVIIKLTDGDLIGGYNPLDWKGENVWKKTSDSFEKKAIGCSTSNSPRFGNTDLYIQSNSNYCTVEDSTYESLN
ncbi:13944_t:CDS:2, partial [Racocetra fulgida]